MTFSLHRFLRDVLPLLGGATVVLLVGFGLNIILARALGPADFGSWAAVVVVNYLLFSLFGQGIEETLLPHLARARQKTGETDDQTGSATALAAALLAGFALRTVCALGLLAGALVIAPLTDSPPVVRLLFVLQAATVLAESADLAWNAMMRDRRRLRLLAALPVAWSLLHLGAVLLLLAGGMLSLFTVAASGLGVSLLRGGVAMRMLSREARRSGDGGLRAGVRAVLRQPRPLRDLWATLRLGLSANAIGAVIRQGDVLLLVALAGDAQTGLYRLAKMLLEYAGRLVRLSGVVSFGDLAALTAARRMADVRRYLSRITALTGGMALLAALPLGLWADDLIVLLYGPAYADAALLFRVMLPGFVVGAALYWVADVAVILGRLRAYVRRMLLALAAFAGLAPALTLWAGPPGMATAVTLVACLAPVLVLLALPRWLDRAPSAQTDHP